MKDNVKRVFYVRQLAHACYLDIIATRPEIRLDKLENDSPDAVATPVIAAAHAYQIGSARDELNTRFQRRFVWGSSTVPSFKATLLKHQYVKTPKSANLYIKKTGGMVLLD